MIDRILRLIKGPGGGDAPLAETLTLGHFAWLTVIASFILSLLGVYVIDIALRPVGVNVESAGSIVDKQTALVGFGVLGALGVALIHPRWIRFVAWPALALVIALLIFLLIPWVPTSIVRPRNGARAWIDLGVTDFQPSELAKVAVVLALASYLRYRTIHRKFLGLILPGIIVFIPVGLITLQPDLGTATLFIPMLFAVLVAAGARLRHLVIIVIMAALAAPAAYPLLKPHQKERIEALIEQIQGDRSSALDINYQSFTSQRLIGAGRVGGATDAHARALVHYNRLPEGHNDMIFAVITTRFGLPGAIFVIMLYVIWLVGAVLTAAESKLPFGRLVVVGLAAVVFAQMLVNVGMAVGLLPIIGVSLPYVSAGGTNLLAAWLMTGLIVGVAMRRPVPPIRPSFEYDD